MVAAKIIFAASSVFTLSTAAPLSSLFTRASGSSYVVYAGDGSKAAGWPEIKDWKSFDDLWSLNSPLMGKQCLDGVTANTQAETDAIKGAVQDAAKASNLDPRFLLVAVMQESGGCVRVGTTYSPAPDNIRNPGLLQDFNGKATCNDPKAGIQPKSPCPESDIKAMVSEGSGATNDGGFKQHYAAEGAKAPTDDAKYYWAARGYNSGSVTDNNLGKGVATHCYASDMANRLMGWTGDNRKCDEATIGTLTKSEGGSASAAQPSSSSAPPPVSSSAPPPVSSSAPPPVSSSAPQPSGSSAPQPSGTVAAPAPTETAAAPTTGAGGSEGVSSSPTGTKAEGAPSSCKGWYTVKSGDNCSAIEGMYGLPTGTIAKLNTGLNAQCSNLLSGVSYCLRA